MGILDKLARLDPDRTTRPVEVQPPDWIGQVQAELQIKVLSEGGSFVMLKENSHPLFDDPAYLFLQKEGFQTGQLHRITGDFPQHIINLRQAVFFDTETTGLSGGTGTYAFLVGVGHLELDHVVVRQYLLPDFAHEWLMLEYLERLFRGYAFTVSFNGKSFDIPLLRNRYVLNRMESSLDNLHHVDILHAARRIWRNRLPSCDLQSLEKAVLNTDRVGDIPGAAIPQIYFDFIRKRDALLLRDVLEHNFHDIVNMVRLTLQIAAIAESPQQFLNHPADRFSLAGHYYRHKHYADVIRLLHETFDDDAAGDRPQHTEAMLMLSRTYKKSGDSASARRLLQKMVDRRLLQPRIIEELAKIYEHEDRDYPFAREVVEMGLRYLRLLLELDPASPELQALPALEHRHRRLVRRCERQRTSASDSSK